MKRTLVSILVVTTVLSGCNSGLSELLPTKNGAVSGTAPDSLPPSGFTGTQWVDTRGCQYVKANLGGRAVWVPKLSASREQICFGGVDDSNVIEPGLNQTLVETVSTNDITNIQNDAVTPAPQPTIPPALQNFSLGGLFGGLKPTAPSTPAPEPAPEPTPEPAPEPAPEPTPAPAPVAPAPVTPAPTPAPTPKPAPQVVEDFTKNRGVNYINVGSFALKSNADQVRAQLSERGYLVVVTHENFRNVVLYNVNALPPNSMRIEKALRDIQGLGFVDAFIIAQ